MLGIEKQRRDYLALIVQKLHWEEIEDGKFDLTNSCYRFTPTEIMNIMEDLGWYIGDNFFEDGSFYCYFTNPDSDLTIGLYANVVTFELWLMGD